MIVLRIAMGKDYIGVAVIGAGRAGMIHARNFATVVPGGRLVALADASEDALKKAGKELGISKYCLNYEEVMENKAVDAVVVATPTVYHKDIVLAAAKAGKHVFCEKPMAMTVRECDEMMEAAEKNGVNLQIGFMRRFDEGFIAAKEKIETGVIGDVVLVKSLTYGPSIPKKWQYDISVSNGPLAEVNSHDIDTLRWFTASEFQEVVAIGGNFRCPAAKEEFPDFYDNVVMVARMANGMQGCINGAVSVRYGYDARVEILGTKGVIFIGELAGNRVVSCSVDDGMVRPIIHSWMNLFKDAYVAEDRDFVDCIVKGRRPKATGLDGKRAVEVVNAGNRSIVEKIPVRLS